jgi:hypothetical protein
MYQGFLSYKQVAFTVLWHTSIVYTTPKP